MAVLVARGEGNDCVAGAVLTLGVRASDFAPPTFHTTSNSAADLQTVKFRRRPRCLPCVKPVCARADAARGCALQRSFCREACVRACVHASGLAYIHALQCACFLHACGCTRDDQWRPHVGAYDANSVVAGDRTCRPGRKPPGGSTDSQQYHSRRLGKWVSCARGESKRGWWVKMRHFKGFRHGDKVER